MVALSVMSGFQEDLRGRLLSFTPQITVERTDGGVWNPAELAKKDLGAARRNRVGAVRHLAGDGGIEYGFGRAGSGVGRNFARRGPRTTMRC